VSPLWRVDNLQTYFKQSVKHDEAVAWLYSTQRVGIKLGLETIRRLLTGLGVTLPIQGGPAATYAPYILHIAGTNGKGSVCAMLDAICRSAGFHTGLFTSPHLVVFRERIQLDGAQIPEADVAAGLSQIRDLVAGWDPHPTFFEITTALALHWFQQQQAEVIVLETGLGGRLDSTNAIIPAVTLITSISNDHWQYLGNTLREIAGEKAGILKPGIPAVSAVQQPPAAQVLEETARRVGAPLSWVADPAPFEVALAGSHQKTNAALAIAGLRAARIPVPESALAEGLRKVVWPGRFQRITRGAGVELVLDGAHNQAAMERLAQTWREVYGTQNPVIVLGVLRDKDVPAICRALAPLAASVLATPVHSVRSCDPVDLAETMRDNAPEIPCSIAESVEAALASAEAQAQQTGRRVLVTGSLFLVGETLALLAGKRSEASAQ
jgi:dihydrofolate synthase/folylpolyglutamate synthase